VTQTIIAEGFAIRDKSFFSIILKVSEASDLVSFVE
jgi:hypothetical protein